MDDRRYGDEEVALILRKATERSLSPRSAGERDGLTLDQLKGIAREVGIDPAAVESAARGLASSRPQGRGGAFIGATATPSVEAVVPVAVPDEKLGDVASVIRRIMGRQGIVSHELGAMEWRARDVVGGRYVSLRPTEGGTRVRAFGNFRDGALMTFVVGGVAGGALLATLLKSLGIGALLGVGTGPVAVAAALLSARFLWKRVGGHEARTLERVVAELEESLGSSRPAQTAPEETTRGGV